MLAIGLYTFHETGSPFLVTAMLFVRTLPSMLLGAPVGALAARLDRKRLLAINFAVLTVTAAVLFVLAHTGRLELWHVAAGALLSGCTWAMDHPIRRTLLGEDRGEPAPCGRDEPRHGDRPRDPRPRPDRRGRAAPLARHRRGLRPRRRPQRRELPQRDRAAAPRRAGSPLPRRSLHPHPVRRHRVRPQQPDRARGAHRHHDREPLRVLLHLDRPRHRRGGSRPRPGGGWGS